MQVAFAEKMLGNGDLHILLIYVYLNLNIGCKKRMQR